MILAPSRYRINCLKENEQALAGGQGQTSAQLSVVPTDAVRSTDGSNSTGLTEVPASAAARCSTTRRSISRMSWAQPDRLGGVVDAGGADAGVMRQPGGC